MCPFWKRKLPPSLEIPIKYWNTYMWYTQSLQGQKPNSISLSSQSCLSSLQVIFVTLLLSLSRMSAYFFNCGDQNWTLLQVPHDKHWVCWDCHFSLCAINTPADVFAFVTAVVLWLVHQGHQSPYNRAALQPHIIACTGPLVCVTPGVGLHTLLP